jgi:GNAT superfamily N-acetyltransferase
MTGRHLQPITLRLDALPGTLQVMEQEAAAAGFAMISRLRSEWQSGLNRFDGAGEILLGTFRGERLIAIGGLNRDPYADDPRLGRLRHLYVMNDERRLGAGRSLVLQLMQHAVGHFDAVRLWSGPNAHAFYEALGFKRLEGPKVTHEKSPVGGGSTGASQADS